MGCNFLKLHCFGPMCNVISLDKETRYVRPYVKNLVNKVSN